MSPKRPGRGAAPVDRQQPWSTRGSRVERIDRVLVDELRPRVTVSGPEAHHLRDVLRVRPGSLVEAFDGRGRVARGAVDSVDRDSVTLSLHDSEPSTAEAALAVTLAVALLKGDKLTDVVRPATELGVRRFELFVSTNCEARELSAVRLGRLRRVAQEAARQSGRGHVPAVEAPVPFEALPIAKGAATGTVVVGDPASPTSLAEYLSDEATTQAGAVTIVTGPEGGLTADEVERLVAAGALAVRLGPRILRADTAPVAIAATLLLARAT